MASGCQGFGIPGSEEPPRTVWCLVGNGGMDIEDFSWGFYRGYYRDPFPHSLLNTRQRKEC